MSECVLVETVVGPLYVREDQLQIGRFLQADGKPPTEDAARAFIERWVKPGDSCIDVGANIGFFTVFLADLVGPEGFVLALDPNGEVLRCLQKTWVERDVPHIGIFQAAAGSHPAWGDLDVDPRGDGGNRVKEVRAEGLFVQHFFRIAPLDQLMMRRPVAFIKCDAEGMDHEVLQGARAILAEDRPVVLFEHNPEQIEARGQTEGHAFAVLLDLCLDLEYVVRTLDGRQTKQWENDMALIPKEKL